MNDSTAFLEQMRDDYQKARVALTALPAKTAWWLPCLVHQAEATVPCVQPDDSDHSFYYDPSYVCLARYQAAEEYLRGIDE